MNASRILLAALCLPLAAGAMDSTLNPPTSSKHKLPPIWVNVGLGAGEPGLAGATNLTWQVRNGTVFQVAMENNLSIGAPILDGTSEEAVSMLGVLMGVRNQPGPYSAALLAGPALVSGYHGGDIEGYADDNDGWIGEPIHHKNHFRTAGLMANAQLFWKPLRYVGVGFQGNVCLNHEISTASLLFSVQLGTAR